MSSFGAFWELILLGRLRVDLIKPVSNVRPFVHKKLSSISMKFGTWVEVDE